MANELKTPEQLEKVNALLDTVIGKLGLKNDAALSRALGVAPPVISKTRAGVLSLSVMMMVRIHDAAGVALSDMRAALGVPPLVPAHGAM